MGFSSSWPGMLSGGPFQPLILGLTGAAGVEIVRIDMRLQRDVEGLV